MIKNQKQFTDNNSKSTHQNTQLCIVFKPFVQITHQGALVIQHQIIHGISYQPLTALTKSTDHELSHNMNESDESSKSIASSNSKSSSGLDCSGQGECQPDIENSDGDQMQRFLVKANRRSSNKRHRLKNERKEKESIKKPA